MLEIEAVDVFYGRRIQALRRVSLEVRPGEVVALLGRNGAGKSTLLRTISGLMHPRRGTIRWNGQRISDWRPAKVVEAGIAHVPEGRQVFPKLSVAENLRLGAYRRKAKSGTLEWVLEMFPRLAERSRQAAGTLSGGEQQMLAIGRSLMSGPELLMIDELSLGLAPIVTEELFRTVTLLREAGTSLLLVEQHVSQALGVADRAYVLNRGTIAFHGTAEEAGRPGVLESSYLGSAALTATPA